MTESENATTTKINVLDFGMNKTKQNGNICIIIIPVGPQKKNPLICFYTKSNLHSQATAQTSLHV